MSLIQELLDMEEQKYGWRSHISRQLQHFKKGMYIDCCSYQDRHEHDEIQSFVKEHTGIEPAMVRFEGKPLLVFGEYQDIYSLPPEFDFLDVNEQEDNYTQPHLIAFPHHGKPMITECEYEDYLCSFALLPYINNKITMS